MHLSTILNVINNRSEELCTNLELFRTAIEEDTDSITQDNDDDNTCLRDLFDQIVSNTMNIVSKEAQKHCKDKEEKQTFYMELEKTKKTEKDLIHSIKTEKERLNKIKMENERSDKKELSNRDLIKACKLLTNTNFNYFGKDISGYMFGEISNSYELFEFKQGTVPIEIKNNLWKLMEKINQK